MAHYSAMLDKSYEAKIEILKGDMKKLNIMLEESAYNNIRL